MWPLRSCHGKLFKAWEQNQASAASIHINTRAAYESLWSYISIQALAITGIQSFMACLDKL